MGRGFMICGFIVNAPGRVTCQASQQLWAGLGIELRLRKALRT